MNTPALPIGQFSLIVADPPWSYNLRETDATHRGRCPYPSMSDDEILALEIPTIATQQCYLLLWTTNNHLPVAFKCLNQWGFIAKALHTWVKTQKANPDKIKMGMGHYGRSSTEHFIVATKGNPPSWLSLGLTNIANVIHEPISEHSKKPEAFYNNVDRLWDALKDRVGGDRIELFARQSRTGWVSWGAEAGVSL
jgi:N6-adenosine-specific RNA methylase IME4